MCGLHRCCHHHGDRLLCHRRNLLDEAEISNFGGEPGIQQDVGTLDVPVRDLLLVVGVVVLEAAECLV